MSYRSSAPRAKVELETLDVFSTKTLHHSAPCMTKEQHIPFQICRLSKAPISSMNRTQLQFCLLVRLASSSCEAQAPLTSLRSRRRPSSSLSGGRLHPVDSSILASLP